SDPDKVYTQLATKDVDIQMVDVQASSPDQMGQRTATIAFTVAFKSDTPEKAQQVANDFTQWFLREHKASREKAASNVSGFLESEAQKLRKEIAARESQLASFKQEELRQLPELRDMNLRLYEKTEQDIATSEETIRGIQEKIDAAAAE